MAKKVFTEQEVRDIVSSHIEDVRVMKVRITENNVLLVYVFGDVTTRELAALGKKFGDDAIVVSGDNFNQLTLTIAPTVYDQEG